MSQIFNKKRGQKGFTLIELLVVIAIIGILAGIVLVALGGARNRAKDARIQADMAQIRTVAEVYNGDEGNFDGLMLGADVAEITTLTNDILGQGGAYSYATAASTYCVVADLNAVGAFWCVDSNLVSSATGSSPGTCVNGTALCY